MSLAASLALLAAAAAAAAAVLAAPAGAQTDGCGSNPVAFLPAAYNSTAFACRPIWNTFILRYSQSQDNVLSIILSALYTTGWVGMGFSKDGMMVGSSAIVGWIGNTGISHMEQFHLLGQSTSKVVANEGELNITNATSAVLIYGANIFVAYQLKFSAPLTQQHLIFAYGSATPVNNRLAEHVDKVSISFDFLSGTSLGSSYPYNLKRNHGILAIFGWGVLLPIGAIVARYCRRWDPLWYYLHAIIQFIGFIIGLAAVLAGITLYNKLHADVAAHRGLGIFVLVLGILQVLAFFLRADKESKIRKYWNWYHHWVGRLALFLAAVNIVVGIHAGGAGRSWRVGYGINVAVIIVASAVLEAVSNPRWRSKISAPPPAF